MGFQRGSRLMAQTFEEELGVLGSGSSGRRRTGALGREPGARNRPTLQPSEHAPPQQALSHDDAALRSKAGEILMMSGFGGSSRCE